MTKACYKCKNAQPASEYYKRSRSSDGFAGICKSCSREYDAGRRHIRRAQQKHRLATDESFRLARKKHYEKWRENNPEGWAEKERKRMIYIAKHKKENRGIYSAQWAQYNAAKLRLTPEWSDLKEIEKIYIKAQKMTEEMGVKYHVDHIYPLQGKDCHGLHLPINLQIITATENIRKSNKILEAGAAQLRGLK